MSDKGTDTESKSTQPAPPYEQSQVKEDFLQVGQSLAVENLGGPQRTEETYRLYRRRFAGLTALVS